MKMPNQITAIIAKTTHQPTVGKLLKNSPQSILTPAKTKKVATLER
jgi:hypothetical protein